MSCDEAAVPGRGHLLVWTQPSVMSQRRSSLRLLLVRIKELVRQRLTAGMCRWTGKSNVHTGAHPATDRSMCSAEKHRRSFLPGARKLYKWLTVIIVIIYVMFLLCSTFTQNCHWPLQPSFFVHELFILILFWSLPVVVLLFFSFLFFLTWQQL